MQSRNTLVWRTLVAVDRSFGGQWTYQKISTSDILFSVDILLYDRRVAQAVPATVLSPMNRAAIQRLRTGNHPSMRLSKDLL